MPYDRQKQGPEESRYIIEGLRFVARVDNEATDEEWSLLAAAPELLAACEKLLYYAEFWVESTPLDESACRDLATARAAIAKAKGGVR